MFSVRRFIQRLEVFHGPHQQMSPAFAWCVLAAAAEPDGMMLPVAVHWPIGTMSPSFPATAIRLRLVLAVLVSAGPVRRKMAAIVPF